MYENPEEITVCVVGLGYIGLPTAAVLASRGFNVVGYEKSAEVVDTINAGDAHIQEPDLDMLVRAGVQTGRLKAVSIPPDHADVFILCVPTPVTSNNKPDLSMLDEAAAAITGALHGDALVIIESTVAPGATDRIAETLRARAGTGLCVAHAPERVLPGRILREVIENDRIVGGVDAQSTERAAAFYRSFVLGNVTSAEARLAESVKLIENAYRDVNIAFANELSMAADIIGVDVWKAIEIANHHPRVSILQPGAGVGGHCIAVDPYFLIDAAGEHNTPLMAAARAVNERKPDWVAKRIASHADKFKAPTIALLGLAYKPDVDDLRMSPALEIAKRVQSIAHANTIAVEPNLKDVEGFTLTDLQEAVKTADIIAILVAHAQFRALPRNALDHAVIVDACGLFA
ncbi:MAG: nucleotide sugar dehydrogenase [Pseudomonadota bacterium]